MPRSIWKYAEDRLAALFGCKRRPLSGSNSRTGGADDCCHPVLHLEAKYGKQCNPIWNLWRKAKAEAGQQEVDVSRLNARGQIIQQLTSQLKIKKIPVLGYFAPSVPGCLLVIHSDDLINVTTEMLKAMRQQLADGTTTSQPTISQKKSARLKT